jgi:hypothetical protein
MALWLRGSTRTLYGGSVRRRSTAAPSRIPVARNVLSEEKPVKVRGAPRVAAE